MTKTPPQQSATRFTRSSRIPSLPPRSRTWIRDSFCLATTGVGICAAAPLFGYSDLPMPASAGFSIAAAYTAVTGKRRQLRDADVDEVVEKLCPIVGLPEATRAVLSTARWSRREWPGHPRKLTVHYDSTQALNDETWLADICEIFEHQGWGFFELDKHDPARRRLIFTSAAEPNQETPDSDQVTRAKRIVTQLLGPTAAATAIEVDVETGDVTSMEVRHELGPKLASEGYRTRVERGMSATLPGRWRAKWNLETDWVRFELRTAFPDSIWLPKTDLDPDADLLASYDSVEIPYGIDEDGNEVVWRPAIDPNMMLIGPPGSGKTVTAHNLLVNFSRRGWPIWVLDGKYVEFLGFQDWPNVQVVATTIEQQVALVHRARDLMEFRYQKIVTGEATETDFEPVLVFLDEWAEFRGNVEDWYLGVKSKGGPRLPPVITMLASMARKARTARVHLVFGTQRPDAQYFFGDMRDNFAMRISMGRLSPQGALMMWQSPTIGTSVPRKCRGRGTTVTDNYQPIEIQCYRVPDPRKTRPDSFEADLLDALRPPVTRHPRLLIVPPDELPDLDATDDTSEPAPLTYFDYIDAEWVLASDRPDLDPILRRANMTHEVDHGIASPTALLGLLGGGAEPTVEATRAPNDHSQPLTASNDASDPASFLDQLSAPHPGESSSEDLESFRTRLALVKEPVGMEREMSGGESDFVDDRSVSHRTDEDQYGPVHDVRAADVALGDLLLIDDLDEWVVVDTDPELDIIDDSLLSLTWRSDSDEYGELALPDSSYVSIRKPLQVSV
ncbi:FtsK/SpoIIIE domain-containing protein [Rhodococcus koreensis]|uniref:FtsK/SpoIIIE family protein n=1 Tax=Rhodococcus koreensis TaxID=99653 RepID=A0A1H4IGX4_9NOCA|nr:FtsK/SpoIIIE family protein [Rhodococcus koreensis]